MAKNKRALSTAQEIQHRFVWMLVLLTLVMGGAVVLTVGYQLVKQSEQSSVELMASLNRSIIDDKPDWNRWRKSSSINTKNTMVRVYNSKIGEAPATFYSPNTQKFLKAKHYQMPIFSAVAYTPGYGFTYYRAGVRLGIHSQIWLSLRPITTVLLSVVLVVLLIMLVTIGVGWGYIRFTARQITQPLSSLNVAAQEQSHVRTTKATLPVPNQPSEVTQLANSINELLTTINQHASQEREFISNAAHELRTPIAAIRGHVRLIERRGQEHPEIVPRSVQFIDDESQRMQKLVNSLLTLSRADRGTLTLAYFDLAETINETVEEEQTVLSQPIRVTGETTAIIYGNAESMHQILVALLDNAGKYSAADQPITLSLIQTAQHVQLAVQDLGLGIADGDKAHVFERFYRVDSARTRQIGGTGLGLAIVAQLVGLNHATIRVSDNLPRGSQFILKFPVAENSDKLSD
ncbi:sensor histidine kinase [Levilactobacillus yiduensis]|uniref:sensor histidine kinase n=1 Tax=Levilactobacillus yiduensis TaxID=2953880 RepID=UPI000EF2B615|nr:HAMP domain-containing sensor histidine kinase [Levilactobacillus yiduensis]AYM03822.1 sensor histidine kinase [Levilactobacillus brevis]